MSTSGWDQDSSGDWGMHPDSWSSSPVAGDPQSSSGSWGTDEGRWGAMSHVASFELPRPVSVAPLALGMVAGAVGIALSWFGTSTSVFAPVLGFALCAFVDVLAVAYFQKQELNAASASMNYRSAPTSRVMRITALALAAAGIVLNSLAIAQWLATR